MCRGNISSILDEARKALDSLLPIPELKELDQLMRATIDATLELLDESAKQVCIGAVLLCVSPMGYLVYTACTADAGFCCCIPHAA